MGNDQPLPIAIFTEIPSTVKISVGHEIVNTNADECSQPLKMYYQALSIQIVNLYTGSECPHPALQIEVSAPTP